MNVNYTSLGLAALGLGLTYSGFNDLKKGSKVWASAKVAVGAALIGNEINFALGGPGNLDRVESLFKTYQDANLQQTCNIPHLLDRMSEEGKDSDIYKVFIKMMEEGHFSCKNFLPWKDSFMRGPYVNGIIPDIDGIKLEEFSHSVMWGISRMDDPFVAIKHTCNDTIGAIAFSQFPFLSSLSPGGLLGGGSNLGEEICVDSYDYINLDWVMELLTSGSATWKGLPEVAQLA